MKNLAPIALAAAFVSVPASAHVDLGQSTTLHYSASDLGSPERLARLEKRIRWAARHVCPTQGAPTLEATREQSECVRSATASAREQLGVALASNAPRQLLANRNR